MNLLTGQKEVLQSPHNEMEVVENLELSHALLPKPALTFLVHTAEINVRPICIYFLFKHGIENLNMVYNQETR